MGAEYGGELRTPQTLGLVFAVLAMLAVAVFWFSYRRATPLSPAFAVVTLATFVGFAYASLKINADLARWNDPTRAVAELKSHLSPDSELVSFTPIEHRFAYYFAAPIAELPWPQALADLPEGVDYFCFMRNPGDTAASRAAGRGRTWTPTSGNLPFAWEELAAIPIERRIRSDDERNERMVVLGRVIRPLQALTSDATVPQRKAAMRELTATR
jgi:hypothetical protein